MTGEFILPNWHVILVHFPIALLSIGVLAELVSLCCRTDGLREAGRWMLVLGAFLSVPAAASGLYAFRDVARPGVEDVQPAAWHRIVASSEWSDAQWETLESHIWYNAPATAAILLAVLVGIAASDRWRERLYWPLLLLVIAGVGVMIAGAAFGGEAVYRYGTGIRDEIPAGPDGGASAGITYFVPPLQLHVLLAGVLLATALFTLAGTVRRWNSESAPGEGGDSTERPKRIAGLWLLVWLVALATSAAGAWFTLGEFSGEAVEANLKLLGEPGHERLLLHVIFGSTLSLLLIVLVFLSWLAPRRRGFIGVVLALFLLAAAGQTWLGTLMLYDGHEGPLTAFVSADEPQKNGQHQPHENGRVDDDHDDAQKRPAEANRNGNASTKAVKAAAVVTMTDDLRYDPERITIRPGEVVRWQNTTGIVHTVTADPDRAAEPEKHVRLPRSAGTFDSGDMQPGEEFTHRFTTPGLYRYFCIPHELAGMIGEIEVTDNKDSP